MASTYIPKWLRKLKPGIYTRDELVVASGGKAKENITRILTRLGVPKFYEENPVCNNVLQVRYKWSFRKTQTRLKKKLQEELLEVKNG